MTHYNKSKSRHRVLYISHGAGPLPLLGDAGHTEMLQTLEAVRELIPKPSAALIISAHWEENIPAVTQGDRQPLYYDYYGFPEEAYRIEYPAPGDSRLSDSIRNCLANSGITCTEESERGLDHGVFVPMKILYPEADIPCVQLSLIKGLDPALHISLGRALAELEHENLLIIGSGFSFHNMKAFFTPPTDETIAMNNEFEDWLIETCSSPELTDEDRIQRLLDWESAPHARYCHPREEHLLPLHVCCGASTGPAETVYELKIFGKKCSFYLW